jgi:metal-responsive CopG/Arc/MetJ family transcriptional regulator
MSFRLQILIPERLAARIRKAAERSRVSRGEWVRRAIERALVEQRAEADPLARLAGLEAPTADIEQMLSEIEAGRG